MNGVQHQITAEEALSRRDIIKKLQVIPGIGSSIAGDLYNIGIRRVGDLKGKNPETLFRQSNRLAGVTQDRCLLYTFRCAVYFAETPDPDIKKLKWWYWKDHK
ncbi:MAG TPA: helix-hairpin-helix domain-containing protein [Puia sp.]|nr:helix-hairpin-helix domain-containing protein [Puia sp.]